jgi:hypothetical protein
MPAGVRTHGGPLTCNRGKRSATKPPEVAALVQVELSQLSDGLQWRGRQSTGQVGILNHEVEQPMVERSPFDRACAVRENVPPWRPARRHGVRG